jgi:hypothetical protein
MSADVAAPVRGTDSVEVPRFFVGWISAGVGLLQLLWILAIPPFRGSDEFDHVYRAAGVAAGQLRATEAAPDGRGFLVPVPASIVDAARAQCEALLYMGPDNCRPTIDATHDWVYAASGAGTYSPFYYAFVGPVGVGFDGSAALYVMRVLSSLLCLALVALAAWATAQRARTVWARGGLVFAMTPVMVYSMSIVAPNGLEMAAALLLWSALLSLGNIPRHRSEHLVLWLAVLAAVVLMLGRTLGPLFVLLAFVTCWLLRPDVAKGVLGRHPRTALVGGALVSASLGLAVWWFLSAGAGSPGPAHTTLAPFYPSQAIVWPLQSIAAFPFRNQMAATVIYPIVLLIFAALVGAALVRGTPRERLVLLGTCVFAFLFPLLLTAATYSGRGSIWQGRYGLPFSIGIVLVAAAVLDRQGWRPRLGGPLVQIGALLMCVGTAACLYKVVTDEQKWLPSVEDASWLEPSTAVLVGGSVLAWIILYRGFRWAPRVR